MIFCNFGNHFGGLGEPWGVPSSENFGEFALLGSHGVPESIFCGLVVNFSWIWGRFFVVWGSIFDGFLNTFLKTFVRFV